MALEICTYPNPVLAQQAQRVEEITPELVALAKSMAETMYETNGIGLAAPQVGESVRLIVVDVTGPELREQLFTIVNPEIKTCAGEMEYEEGCLSLPQFSTVVKRSACVTVTGTDLEGRPVEIEAEGLLAICLQHEIDHLEGTLLLNHVGRVKKALYDKRVKKHLKQAKQSPSGAADHGDKGSA